MIALKNNIRNSIKGFSNKNFIFLLKIRPILANLNKNIIEIRSWCFKLVNKRLKLFKKVLIFREIPTSFRYRICKSTSKSSIISTRNKLKEKLLLKPTTKTVWKDIKPSFKSWKINLTRFLDSRSRKYKLWRWSHQHSINLI